MREPVAVAGLVRVVLVAAAAFGVGFSEEQIVAVVAVVEAISTVLVRQRVTPWTPGEGFEA